MNSTVFCTFFLRKNGRMEISENTKACSNFLYIRLFLTQNSSTGRISLNDRRARALISLHERIEHNTAPSIFSLHVQLHVIK